METIAKARFVHISPQKIRLVMDEVRGIKVDEAVQRLGYAPQKGARMLRKLVQSAIANAEQNAGADVDKLYIKRIYADEGPLMKRWRPRALGRATRIRKRTSHLTVVLDEA